MESTYIDKKEDKMQTFLPVPSFIESAKCLDNKRLGKQRVEAYQILKALLQGPYKPLTTGNFDIVKYNDNYHLAKIHKTGWYNHPAVQMWKGYEKVLCHYGLLVCEEWTDRGFNDSMAEKFDLLAYTFDIDKSGMIIYTYPKWLGDDRFHKSHRSNLLRKDLKHYDQFGWEEPDNLPYFWPTKEGY